MGGTKQKFVEMLDSKERVRKECMLTCMLTCITLKYIALVTSYSLMRHFAVLLTHINI